jgi:hypoxanthine-DNA glycosylase
MAREEHPPHWYHPIKNMRTLILGSFPPHENKRHFDFYYPNKQNRFWKVLACLAGRTLLAETGPSAVAERKMLMADLRIGIHDVAQAIERNGKSSLDRDITITDFQDILGIIDTHKTLTVILLTGYSGPSSAYQSFIKYLEKNRIEHTTPAKVVAGQSFTFVRGRTIKCILGNSTSRAARGIGLTELVRQFNRAIIEEHQTKEPSAH